MPENVPTFFSCTKDSTENHFAPRRRIFSRSRVLLNNERFLVDLRIKMWGGEKWGNFSHSDVNERCSKSEFWAVEYRKLSWIRSIFDIRKVSHFNLFNFDIFGPKCLDNLTFAKSHISAMNFQEKKRFFSNYMWSLIWQYIMSLIHFKITLIKVSERVRTIQWETVKSGLNSSHFPNFAHFLISKSNRNINSIWDLSLYS